MRRGFDVPEACGVQKGPQLTLGNHTATDQGLVELDAGHHLICRVAPVVPW